MAPRKKPVARKPAARKRRATQKPAPVVVDMSVKASVQRDIDALAKRDPKIASSGLAALALSLAGEMDAPNSPTSKSMCARALAETLAKLESLVPPEEKLSRLDELAAKRSKRLTA